MIDKILFLTVRQDRWFGSRWWKLERERGVGLGEDRCGREIAIVRYLLVLNLCCDSEDPV